MLFQSAEIALFPLKLIIWQEFEIGVGGDCFNFQDGMEVFVDE
jgi:hypothetical protein